MNDENIKRLRSARLNLNCRLIGLFPTYDLLISTSKYYTQHAFSKAFKIKKIIESGYPRNDCFFNSNQDTNIVNTDTRVIQTIREYKKKI